MRLQEIQMSNLTPNAQTYTSFQRPVPVATGTNERPGTSLFYYLRSMGAAACSINPPYPHHIFH